MMVQNEKLSASRIATIISCPRKYVYKYILKLPDVSGRAAAIGKAFHNVLEGKEIGGEDGLEEVDAKIVRKMARSHTYATRHLKPVRFKEVKFENEFFLGFVDAVRVDDAENWSIAERKTAGDLSRFDTAKKDLQLCAYAFHAPVIASDLGLKMENFRGIDLEITLKPTERIRAKETVEAFVERATVCTEARTISEFEAFQMKEHFKNQYNFADHLRKMAHFIFSQKESAIDVPVNQHSCKLFNTKCPYFEKCYGAPTL